MEKKYGKFQSDVVTIKYKHPLPLESEETIGQLSVQQV